jgi:hypothetical protein
MILISYSATCNAQLTKIWDRSNEGFEFARLCSPGKLAVVAKNGVNQFLIDLTNGATIHSEEHASIYTNYWGDHYYVSKDGILSEYDVKTKEFIRIAKSIMGIADSSTSSFYANNNSLRFYNANTCELLDSFKIPGSPDEPLYSLRLAQYYSYDGRFYAFHLQMKNNPQQNNFFLYDRQTREIIMQKKLPANSDLLMQFFNKSNLMAYAEEVQLDGDDKPYSYIRIYDPDQRMVIKDIQLSNIEHSIYYFLLSQNDKFFNYSTIPYNDVNFYDYEKSKKSDFKISDIPGPFYIDDSLYVASDFSGYKFDWSIVGVEDPHNPNQNITIYPNPTTNTINLNIESKYFNGNWQLMDLKGRILIQGIIIPNPQLQISLGILPSQTYLLRLRKDNFTVTYNVIKI